ncbi:MAG: DNA repair exonuclease [Clostridia bacterium]|nr:DNA repair exonuclease [Clostridia bacterium]
MIKFIHAADFHLDSPFRALPADKAAQRRAEQRELLDRFGRLAQDRGADLVLLSGDLLDGDNTYYETAQALARVLGQIKARVFIAPGNHDPCTPRSVYSTMAWPQNVHIFRNASVEAVEVPELHCVVYGCAFTGTERGDSPLAGFHAPEDGRLHFMCVHGDVGIKNSRYGPIDASEIRASGLDYLALGHVHTRSEPARLGGTVWAYPGCPEGRGFDELGDKGVLWGQAEQGSLALEFVHLCRRRYEILEVDASADFETALPDNAKDDSYRIIITGESGVEGVDVAALEKIAARHFYSVTLRDETKIRRDLWSRSGEDTLTGLFLRRMAQLRGLAREENDPELIEQAVRFALAALEHGEDCCP